jgi:hypothetical protein
LLQLREKIGNRKRVFLSNTPVGMKVPVEIDTDLYTDACIGTEDLIHTLTKEILDAVHFDYSSISVVIEGGENNE